MRNALGPLEARRQRDIGLDPSLLSEVRKITSPVLAMVAPLEERDGSTEAARGRKSRKP